MASAKDLKRKIQSISNTRKITRTMEMVSAAKSKQAQVRVEANTPYSQKLAELLESVSASATIDHFLLREPEGTSKNALVVVTANRGLCGGYNSSVLSQAEKWIAAEREQGRDTDVIMLGKKGISRFRFRGIPVHTQYTHFGDRPTFREAEDLARMLMERLARGEVARVWVISTRYLSAATQRPVLTQVLPIVPGQADRAPEERRAEVEFIFEPAPKTILEALLPFSVSQLVYRLLIEAAVSEQIARRLAMKLATDNASELIRMYTRKYNRERQAGITQQIMEVVAGAEALG